MKLEEVNLVAQPVQKKLSKYSIVRLFFALLILVSAVLPANVLAATNNQTSGGVVDPQVTAEGLNSADSLKAGSAVPFTFTLNNVENRGFFDIGYRVYLVDAKGDIYFQKDFPRLFVLPPFEKLNVESSFDLPQAIPSGDYFLKVAAISPDNSDLGDIQKKVTVNGTGSSVITFGDVSISSGEMKSPMAKGIVVNPGETVSTHIALTSTTALSVKQKYKIYSEGNFGDGVVNEGEGDAVAIKVGANKYDFSVKSPDKGGNFTMAYWLVDAGGQQVSPIARFGWGVWGGLPGLNYISVDKLSAKKGENVDVEVALIPSVAKENIGEVMVKVWVGNNVGEKKLDFSQGAVVLVPVSLKGDVNTPTIRVAVEKDGKTILEYKTSNKSGLGNNLVQTAGVVGGSGIWYFGFGVFAVVALVLAFLFIKNKRNTMKVAVVLLFGFTFIFFAHKDSFASTSSDTRWTSVASVSCGPPGGYYYITNFFIYKNGSLTAASQDTLFRPGDTIRFEGRVHSTDSCSLRGNGSVALSIGSTDLGAVSESSWDVTYTIPATLDNIGNKSTRAVATWDGPVFNTGSWGSISTTYDMVIKMGPQAVDVASLGTTAPVCAGSTYNMTFNFAGRALAENYDIAWATDPGFTNDFGKVTIAGGSGAKTYTTTNAPFDRTKTYYWRVTAYNSNAGSGVTTTAAGTFGPVAACPTPPVKPSNFSAAPSCNGSNPEVLFSFTDNSTDETSFTIEVSRNAGFTPPVPVKTLAAHSGTGLVMFIWGSAATANGPLDDGSLPLNSTTYYPKVRAVNANGSNGFAVPSPEAFMTPNCAHSDLEVRFDSATWRDGNNLPVSNFNFQPNDIVSVDVIVTNLSSNTSPQTDLYIYYKNDGNNMPDCSIPRLASGVPSDAGGTPRGYTIPQLDSSNSYTARIPVKFEVGGTGATAYAYAVPNCEFDSSPWGNNVDSQAYIISLVGFFETRGGDVGTPGDISVSADSRALGIYQSEYILAAGSSLNSVHSAKPWEIINYGTNNLVPAGGVYNYFKQRFLASADVVQAPCLLTVGIHFCDGDLTTDDSTVVPAGDTVMFVNGNLRVENDFTVPASSTLVFLVNGNIYMEKAVVEVGGVFITKGDFYDVANETEDGGISGAAPLTISGALYVDGTLNLKRYFTTGGLNSTKASDVLVFQPKYLVRLVNLIGVKSINWQELAP